MKDVFWLVSNTLRVTFKNKKNIIMYILVPLIGILISFIAYGGAAPTTTNVGIINNDSGKITSDMTKFIDELDHVKVSNVSRENMKDRIASGEIDCVIIIHDGFSQNILDGKPSDIEITSIKGAQITGYIKSYLNNYIDNIALLGKISKGDQHDFQSMYENYQHEKLTLNKKIITDTSKSMDITYFSIGFLIMIMLMSAGNLSEIILKEKQNRTYFRILATPIDAKKYIFSNIIVNMIVMTIQIILTLFSMKFIFHIDIHIPFWEAATVMMLFALISIGISLIIVAFSKNTASSGALQNLIVLPTVMLSGCFWPVEIMPKAVQRIADFLPQRWTLDTIDKLQQGTSFGSLYLNLLILLAFAIAFFLIAIYKLGRNNSTKIFI